MKTWVRCIFFLIVLVPAPTNAQGTGGVVLEPAAVQVALIRYMKDNPDCFAGFTSSLIKAAAQGLWLSENKKTAYIGSIKVDLTNDTYEFGHWTEDAKLMGGIYLTWKGKLRLRDDGSVEIDAPLLTQERYHGK